MDDTTQANPTGGATPRSMAGSFATVASFALATGASWGVYKATQSLRSWWRGKEGGFSSDDVAHEHDAHSESSDRSDEKGCHGPSPGRGKSVLHLTRTRNGRMDPGDPGSKCSDGLPLEELFTMFGNSTVNPSMSYPSLTSSGKRFYCSPHCLLVVDGPSAVTAESSMEPPYRGYDPDTDGPRVQEVAD